jgi:hypothetical protein
MAPAFYPSISLSYPPFIHYVSINKIGINKEEKKRKQEDKEQEEEDALFDGCPEDCNCPISLKLMLDPVVATDGMVSQPLNNLGLLWSICKT